MTRFQRYYRGYRRVGFSRLDSFRFAWMVAAAGAKPILARATTNRRANPKY